MTYIDTVTIRIGFLWECPACKFTVSNEAVVLKPEAAKKSTGIACPADVACPGCKREFHAIPDKTLTVGSREKKSQGE